MSDVENEMDVLERKLAAKTYRDRTNCSAAAKDSAAVVIDRTPRRRLMPQARTVAALTFIMNAHNLPPLIED